MMEAKSMGIKERHHVCLKAQSETMQKMGTIVVILGINGFWQLHADFTSEIIRT